eukprot:603599-Amphidinium_carterae.1
MLESSALQACQTACEVFQFHKVCRQEVKQSVNGHLALRETVTQLAQGHVCHLQRYAAICE